MHMANITFDALEPVRLATFWAAATGRELTELTPDIVVLTAVNDPVRLLFLKVSEVKTAKNRMHLDFHTADRAAEVTRLLSLGATAYDTHHEYGLAWTVLTDPEGNEFCVAQEGGNATA
jgi:ribulose-5-phosphate 4-epimerase/fuculose-1-phosphate aldolase